MAEPRFLTRSRIDPAELSAATPAPEDGAVAAFTGIVRNHHQGRRVLWLEYEAHEQMAEKHIDRIIQEARRRWPVGKIAIRHRLGRTEVGDVTVAIAVAAPHRGEALEACRWLIDTLKDEVPIFKKEAYSDGETWVEDSRQGHDIGR